MDSKKLFAKQVGSHTEALTTLLGSHSGQQVSVEVMERCLVATNMLAGTSSLMELEFWEKLFTAFELLVETYRNKRLPWDERLSHITEDLIAKEKRLMSAYEAATEVTPGAVVAEDGIVALINEIATHKEECDTLAVHEPEPVADLYEMGATTVTEVPAGVRSTELGGPMPKMVAEMTECARRLYEGFRTEAWQMRKWNSITVSGIQRDLRLVEFMARSAESVIAISASEERTPPRCDTSPLASVLQDYAAELVNESGRELHVRIDGPGTGIDPRLLTPVRAVLQCMMQDIFERCETGALAITITLAERNGALHWIISDDGDNRLSDSRLDNEDHLAFYPRLKKVIRTLHDCDGILWVEPGGGSTARFEFTVPSSTSPVPLIVWQGKAATFAARASQLCEIIPAASKKRSSDAYGEHVEVDGSRVPLIKLNAIYGGAPGDGEMIAVLGSVEKRVAVFVPNAGTARPGRLTSDAISIWQGATRDVVVVDNQRMPVVEAGQVLGSYLDATGTLSSQKVSGGVSEDESKILRQAAFVSNASTPPEHYQKDGEAPSSAPDPNDDGVGASRVDTLEVLIVEQSESMRNALIDMLKQQRVHAASAGGVDEAMSVINSREPRLIISEFRMPTMAAKRLVDSLRDSGRSIPVLVTTSQTGKTADMLVEKLGVSGYLSKPLRLEEVSSQLSCFLNRSAGV